MSSSKNQTCHRLVQVLAADIKSLYSTDDSQIKDLRHLKVGLEFLHQFVGEDGAQDEALTSLCISLIRDEKGRISEREKLIALRLVIKVLKASKDTNHVDGEVFHKIIQRFVVAVGKCEREGDDEANGGLEWSLLLELIKNYRHIYEKLDPDWNDKATADLGSILKSLVSVEECSSIKGDIPTVISAMSKLLAETPVVMDCISILMDRADLTMKLTGLCSFAESLFHPRNALKLLSDDFWLTVLEGLCVKDNLARKQSLYLLKRSIEGVLDGSIILAANCSLVLSTKASLPLQRKLWNDFFLIMDSSDEKQVHIIKQITSRVSNLLNFVTDEIDESRPMHFSWLLVVYEVLFGHQNQAVAKWSINFFLCSFRSDNISKSDERVIRFISGRVLEALNNSKAFSRDSTVNLEDNILSFLLSWTKSMSMDVLKKFWNRILLAAFDKSWGPIPLFYISKAMHEVISEQGNLLYRETIDKLGWFVAHSMHCQEPLLKCGAQCLLLEVVLNCSTADIVSKDLFQVAALLQKFYGPRKVLIYGTDLWQKSVSWITNSFKVDNTNDQFWHKKFDECSCEDERKTFALTLALISRDESTLESSGFIQFLVKDIKESQFRPYNVNNLRNLILLCDLIDIYSPPERREGRSYFTYGSTMKSYEAGFLKTETGIVKSAIQSLPDSDFELFKRILHLAFYINEKTAEASLQHSFVRENFDALTQGSLNGHKLIQSAIVIDTAVNNPGLRNQVFAQLYVNDKDLHTFLSVTDLVDCDNSKKRADWRQHISRKWNILSTILDTSDISNDNFCRLLESAFESVSLGGVSLPKVNRGVDAALKNILSPPEERSEIISQTSDNLCKLFYHSYAAVFELRRNDQFWPSMVSFIDLIYSNSMIRYNNKDIQATQLDILQKLLLEAETVTGIAPIIAIRLYQGSIETNTFPYFMIPCLGKMLAFGPLHRKDQRLVMEANQSVLAAKDTLTANLIEGSDHSCDSLVRAYTAYLLQFFAKDEVMEKVSNELKSFDDLVTNGKSRYYDNSLIHLTKHRLLQGLLILSPHFSAEVADTLVQRLLASIMEDSLQVSLRHYSEWILIKLIRNHDTAIQHLHRCYEKAKTARLGSIPSFLIIYYFLAKGCLQDETLLDATMERISPWCMSQFFGTRVCAQICLNKLYNQAVALNRPHFQSKYAFLVNCIDQCVHHGNCEKNVAKLEEDFFLSVFDPEENFNLKDICYEFPRLCGIQREEWAHFETYELLHSLSESKFIPLHSSASSNLSSINSHKQKSELDMNEMGNEDSIVQKKITPWRSMFSDEVDVTDEKPAAFPNLVVVASLIDRLPNLGGLCRTCEILGVGEYVIASKRFCDDKEFRSVSVTAQNWVPISEVPPAGISDFLSSKRQEGFTIVAVEQTSQSKSLEKYEFPEKTVLLLGNEKEGIPVELIQEVDVCVEIPQKGLIRSFNVHVTGALVLWEYVRQKSIDCK